MKITPEHYEHLKNEISQISREQVAAHREYLKTHSRVKDLEMRLRWDCLYLRRLSPWLCENVYKYANDDHIDTALRRIMSELDLAK